MIRPFNFAQHAKEASLSFRFERCEDEFVNDFLVLHPQGTVHAKKNGNWLDLSVGDDTIIRFPNDEVVTIDLKPPSEHPEIDTRFDSQLDVIRTADEAPAVENYLYQSQEKAWFKVVFEEISGSGNSDIQKNKSGDSPFDFAAYAQESGNTFDHERVTQQPCDEIELRSSGQVEVLVVGMSGLPEREPLKEGVKIKTGDFTALLNSRSDGSQLDLWANDTNEPTPDATFVFNEEDVAWYRVVIKPILKPVDYRKYAKERGILFERKAATKFPRGLSFRSDGSIASDHEENNTTDGTTVLQHEQQLSITDDDGLKFVFRFFEHSSGTTLEMWRVEDGVPIPSAFYEFNNEDSDWVFISLHKAFPNLVNRTQNSQQVSNEPGLIPFSTAEGHRNQSKEAKNTHRIDRTPNRSPWDVNKYAREHNYTLDFVELKTEESRQLQIFTLLEDGRVAIRLQQKTENLPAEEFWTIVTNRDSEELCSFMLSHNGGIAQFEFWHRTVLKKEFRPADVFVYKDGAWYVIGFQASITGTKTFEDEEYEDKPQAVRWSPRPVTFCTTGPSKFIVHPATLLRLTPEPGSDAIWAEVQYRYNGHVSTFETRHPLPDYIVDAEGQRLDAINICCVGDANSDTFYPVVYTTDARDSSEDNRITGATICPEFVRWLLGDDTRTNYERSGMCPWRDSHKERFYALYYNALYACSRLSDPPFDHAGAVYNAEWWADWMYGKFLPWHHRKFSKKPKDSWKIVRV
ncbi:hypothetical protein Enr13x_38030 [Stieleria neptunia]|uniref:Uncharacterized protein n=1 Tax=Stieleria neptunia TaxID=2527979 RepID=A0A518HSW3_9BACT|nr:hypothetical protein [Stieleria neptunia]QDV43943.1 hypothetical protein Enr13x_38030 [Stieleria neptunia]